VIDTDRRLRRLNVILKDYGMIIRYNSDAQRLSLEDDDGRLHASLPFHTPDEVITTIALLQQNAYRDGERAGRARLQFELRTLLDCESNGS